jgi:RHS repeat-associated protein
MTTTATYPFGEVSRSRSVYRGEQYDSDLALYYLRARYYNPATGRFMSRDPEDGNAIDPASLHKYLYAGGDPVNAKDPTGRASMLETAWIYVKRILPVVTAVYACGKGIQALYLLINDALDNAYNLPGHKYVSEWDLIKQVYGTAAACAGPLAGYLYKSY